MSAEVDALLERLVAQFESPYDFLRELVQNAMDAGSDRVEVTLESHPIEVGDAGGGGDPEAVIFELTVLDTGAGMDEGIIDQELTRLFSSGKSGDRTMAGGFGIGFVSVFAWEPEAVLLHTGRGGESWELVFHGDRSFEKVAVDSPIEGTTVALFRRGRGSEREAIADAIRESLWRWCRYCPLELSFEDLDADEPPELIQDAPEPAQLGLAASLTRTEQRGESTLRVSFAVPPSAVFLRRGLILAEGSPRVLLTGVAQELGPSAEHLQIWADSPLLRTSLARDKVLDDEGRVSVEGRLLALVASLREDLLTQLEQLASVGEDALDLDEERVDPRWTRARHGVYAALHAHLELERGQLERAMRGRAILRDLAHARAVSLDAVIARMGARPLLLAPPPALLREAEGSEGESSEGSEPGSVAAGLEALLRALGPTSFPVLAGDAGEDGTWLAGLAALADVELVPIEQALARVEPRVGEALGLCGLVQGLLQGLGFEQLELGLAEFVDLRGRPLTGPIGGPEVVGAARPLAFHGGATIPAAKLRRRTFWLNAHNHLVEAALRSYASEPLLTGLSLSCAILGRLDKQPELGELAKLGERLEHGAVGAPT